MLNAPTTAAPGPPTAANPAGGAATASAASTRAANRRLGLIAFSLALLTIGALVIWWYAGLRNRFFPDNFGVVEPGRIFRSAQIHPRILRQTLAENHIAVILDLAHETTPEAQAEQTIAADMGIEQHHWTLSGNGTGNPAIYTEALEQIIRCTREGKPVLVHCQSGSQRTSGVIAAYRILVEHWSKDDAFAEAKRFHHRPSSNPLLFPYVEEHLSQWKSELERDHFLPPP